MTDVPVAGAVNGFPYVQRLWGGRIALVGLNSARWRPPFDASGELGAAQLHRHGGASACVWMGGGGGGGAEQVR
jgi:hypothetical protein